MACVTCGKSFDSSFFAVMKRKKKEYETIGTEYYFYRKDEETDWSITRREYFKVILEKEKPSEFYHISEFKPD